MWVTLQTVLSEVLKVQGGNDYTVPHINKERLIRERKFKERLNAPTWAVLDACQACYGDMSTQDETQIKQPVTKEAATHTPATQIDFGDIEEEDDMDRN